MNSRPIELLLHLSPGDPVPVREQIARQLRSSIVRGDLPAEAVLPPYRQIARQHRIPPSTVEGAVELLIGEGLLVIDPRGEVAVAELGADERRALVERLQLEEMVARELGKRELEMARDVQRRLLPPGEQSGRGWDLAARCQPARVVAGDFYDVLRHGDGAVSVVVADVAGKGFAASLIMASVKAMLPFVVEERDAAEALTGLNRRLEPELGRGEFVALALARFRPSDGVVELANAGAPDPYVVEAGREPQPLSVPGPRLPLGVRAEVAYSSRRVGLESGRGLLMLTDGLPEARDAAGEPLGYGRLEQLIGEQSSAETPAVWLAGLFDRLQLQTGRLPDDDWTAALLVPRPNATPGETDGAESAAEGTLP